MNEIKLKTFHCEVINDRDALKSEEENYKELPVITNVTQQMIMENYYKIKREVENLIETEIEILLNTPGEEHLLSN